MLKWLPLLGLVTVALFMWFVVAFTSDNNDGWPTSEAVQILTGLGTLAGTIAVLTIVGLTAGRVIRRRRSTH